MFSLRGIHFAGLSPAGLKAEWPHRLPGSAEKAQPWVQGPRTSKRISRVSVSANRTGSPPNLDVNQQPPPLPSGPASSALAQVLKAPSKIGVEALAKLEHTKNQDTQMWPPWTLPLACCLLFFGDLVSGQRCNVRTNDASIAVNSFGLTLFQHIKNTTSERNTVFSPLSVSTAASFISLFANGSTKQEVDGVFNFDPEGSIPQTLVRLPRGGSFGAYDAGSLAVANGLFVQQDLEVEEQFEQTVGDSLKRVNFRRPKAARKGINAWAAAHTNGLIKDVLPKGSLNAQTRLVLANAVLFQSNWEETFDPTSTKRQPFYGAHGEEEGPFMYQFDRRLQWKGDPVIGQVLELPYEDSHFSMYIVLPNVGSSVAAITEVMTRGDIGKWLTEGNQQLEFSSIAIPKFEIELSLELNDALVDLGVMAAFDPMKADFTRITQEAPLHIDKALHKARIIVNETGTRAAGVTSFTVLALSARIGPEQHFIADRPFMYFIVDKRKCMVLFMGDVETLRQ